MVFPAHRGSSVQLQVFPAVHSRESNLEVEPVDHKSNALTTTPLICSVLRTTVAVVQIVYSLFVDLSGVNSRKCFVVHTLNVDDLEHPTITGLIRNPACYDVKFQFTRSSEHESNLLGSVNFLVYIVI